MNWVLLKSERNGEQLREQFGALTANGAIYRELVSHVENGPKAFANPNAPQSQSAKAIAEAMIYIDGVTVLAALSYTQQYAYKDGEKYVELWMASTPAGATTAGKVYRSTTTYFDNSAQQGKAFQAFPGQINDAGVKALTQSMCLGN